MEDVIKIGDEVKVKGTNYITYVPKLAVVGYVGRSISFPLEKYTLGNEIKYVDGFVLCKWWDQQNKKFTEEIFNLQNLEKAE